jgi:hypothetical protein
MSVGEIFKEQGNTAELVSYLKSVKYGETVKVSNQLRVLRSKDPISFVDEALDTFARDVPQMVYDLSRSTDNIPTLSVYARSYAGYGTFVAMLQCEVGTRFGVVGYELVTLTLRFVLADPEPSEGWDFSSDPAHSKDVVGVFKLTIPNLMGPFTMVPASDKVRITWNAVYPDTYRANHRLVFRSFQRHDIEYYSIYKQTMANVRSHLANLFKSAFRVTVDHILYTPPEGNNYERLSKGHLLRDLKRSYHETAAHSDVL